MNLYRILFCVLLILGLCGLPGCVTGHTQRHEPAAAQQPARAVPPEPGEVESAASARSPWIGLPAPAFALTRHDGQTVSLDDYRGRWLIVYFFPKADTPACTCQATEFTDLLKAFKRHNATILGISPDTPGNQRFFKQKHGIAIDMLSDPSHQTLRDYGAWVNTEVAGRSIGRVIRSTFLIDPLGRVAWHWPEVIPEGHAQRVHDRLRRLQESQG